MVNEQIKIECPKCGYEFTEHGIAKEKGYLYFIDGKGNVGRTKMARGNKKKK